MTEDPLPVGYCCFADQRNVGDYCIHQANQRLFPRFRLVDAIHDETHVNLFGGGTLYPYGLRWKYPRRPLNFSIGIGVQEPVKRKFGLLTRWAMHRWNFPVLGLRGPRSREVLRRHGIHGKVTGDTALALEVEDAGGESTSAASLRVAVCLVGEPIESRFGEPCRVERELTDACQRLQASGLAISVIPFCQDDLEASRRLHDQLVQSGDCTLVDFWASPISGDLPRFLRELAACRFMLGERLHAAVMAAAVGVPFLAIGYRPKCFDFVESLDLSPAPIVHPDALNGEQAAGHVLANVDNQGLRLAIQEKVEGWRQTLRATAEEIQRIALDA